MSVTAFHYTPDPAALRDFGERLRHAHSVAAAADPQGRLGIPQRDLARLLRALTAFDWGAFTARVNAHPAYLREYGAQRLHFVHVPSREPCALPVLLLHGWPGSFLEFGGLIGELTRGTPAFHVVCASLPGYAFSSRDPEKPCTTGDIADELAALMQSLGYERYLVQGGDWGSIVGAQLARRHPAQVLGLHVNLAAVAPPPEGHPARAAVEAHEAAWLAEAGALWKDGMGYYAIQSTRPQTLAVALGDSPRGLLAWLAEKFLAWSDRGSDGASLVSDTAILDHVALYWLTGTIGSAVRLYYDHVHDPGAAARVSVPTGVAIFPREIIKAPRAWVAHHFNLVHWTLLERGGHFAALEVPQLLIADLRAFAAVLRGS